MLIRSSVCQHICLLVTIIKGAPTRAGEVAIPSHRWKESSRPEWEAVSPYSSLKKNHHDPVTLSFVLLLCAEPRLQMLLPGILYGSSSGTQLFQCVQTAGCPALLTKDLLSPMLEQAYHHHSEVQWKPTPSTAHLLTETFPKGRGECVVMQSLT